MSNLPLTEWMPCHALPIREGWYEVERRSFTGKAMQEIEKVRFNGAWWEGTCSASGIPVLIYYDIWRGVAIDPEAK